MAEDHDQGTLFQVGEVNADTPPSGDDRHTDQPAHDLLEVRCLRARVASAAHDRQRLVEGLHRRPLIGTMRQRYSVPG
ncbi:hypothetical protein [Streptomyces sp. NPDC087297]|uniref:hypothetical protein n=1 Tax=Streptomyces sp. NPDC087297 TaxID=3365778 RepID=UPI0038262D9C